MVTYSNLSDQVEIWLSFKEGRESALRLLMKQFYGTMYNYGCKFSKNDAFIKDCIQDVFIGMWQYRETMSVPVNTRAYLLTALRRKMFTNKPSDKIRSLKNEDYSSQSFLIEPSPELILIEEEFLQEQSRMIADVLGQLSERQREIIYLKFYQGLNRDDIARVMGISDQSVSNLLQKAIHSLRRVFPSNITLMAQCIILLWF